MENEKFSDELNQELFQKYDLEKDLKTRNRIVVLNQPLVSYIIGKNYSNLKLNNEVKQDVFQEGMMGLLYSIEKFDYKLGFKFSTYACVPLTTQILTQRGWKYYNEIQEGDKTLGYKNGKTEWTKINGVVKYDDAPLVRFGDSLWNAVCTPQHKWLIEEDGETKLRPLTEWPTNENFEWPTRGVDGLKRPKTKLITSAPFVGGNSKLTKNEASILAWILSDGSLQGWKERKAESAVIMQSNRKFANKIKKLLIKENAYISTIKKDNDCVSFDIKKSALNKIWKKSGLENQTISNLVLSLKPDVRKAWFDTWYMAEGTLGRRGIAQNNGEKLDALALCSFLEGNTDTHIRKKTDKLSIVNWHMKNRTPRKCNVTPIGNGEVWCPNTELGSWTAKTEDGAIFLTGNTWWVKQRINNYLSANTVILIPNHIRADQNKLLKELRKSGKNIQDLDCSSKQDIEKYNLTNKKLKRIQSAVGSKKIISLNAAAWSENDSFTVEDLIEDTKSISSELIDNKSVIAAIKMALKEMPEKRRLVLLLRYGVINEIDLIKGYNKK